MGLAVVSALLGRSNGAGSSISIAGQEQWGWLVSALLGRSNGAGSSISIAGQEQWGWL